MFRPVLLAVVLGTALLPAVASAAAPRPGVTLPGDAAAASVRADRSTWIVGARPVRAADGLAAAHGARRVGTGAYVVARARARTLARALRGRGMLLYAEPDRLARRMQAPPPDPLDARAAWRAAIVDPRLVPPPVTPASPLLALVDSQLDITHPEFAGGNVATLGGLPVQSAHGTETAAVAAAPKNDVGILGVWPGMRALNVPLPEEIRCSDSVSGISRAIAQGAAVINMSYGATAPCFAEYAQLQLATAKGITLVAAAGNELSEGNPLLFPASLPHVLTVAAVGSDLKAPFFSSASAAVDLAAPGVGILSATPPQFDEDGLRDGYEAVTGTSFSAPMVAAAAAWLRAAKPQLKVDQVAQTLRASARDLGTRGWDSATGFGLLSVSGAVALAAPAADPHEPNDDMAWVDGRALGRKDSAVWHGGRPARLRAHVDKLEDPADVYRIVFPPHAKVRVSLKPRFGDADLAAFTRSATSTADDEQLIGRSRHNGRRKDSLVLRNPSGRSRPAFLVAYIDADTRALDSRYDLSVRRLSRR
ncbi:MAG: S8 family serine peptidase [Solirubrobacteraceae bacterium]